MRSLRPLLLILVLAVGGSTRALAAPAPLAGALPLVAPNGRMPPVSVLVWHDIEREKAVWFDTTAADFSRQLDAIARGGFHVIDLATLRDHLVRGTPVPRKSLVLTFDDNGAGIYEIAYPLLRSHRFHATLFVHTNYVGRTTSKRHNTWDQLREMERSGLVDVQSLTANHPPDLTVLTDADVVHEFELSRFSLTQRLGRPVYAVAYPYDVYDARVERLAAAHGYALGFTEDHGLAGDSPTLLAIHRYSILTRFDEALAAAAAP